MPKDFYVELAGRLRAVHRRQAERLERERPARADAGHLALDDALDALTSADAKDLLRDVERALRDGVQSVAHVEPEPFSVGTYRVPLEDKFLDGVLDYYRSQYEDIDARFLPQAIVTALAKAAGEHGFVDATALEKMSPVGAQLLARLPALERAPHESNKSSGKYLGLGMHVARKVARSKERDGYLARMPVVRDLCALQPAGALAGVAMASVQHLFPSAMALYDMLFAAGVDPEDAHVGGKFYSANVNTLATMEARGMRVAMSPSWPDELDADAELAVRAMARDELAHMFHGLSPREIKERKFLLLDDGGKLIKALHEFYPQYATSCVCVEQTTRGIQVLDEMKAAGTPVLCPVVNMAQCELKRVVESPLIAESIAWHTDSYVRALGLADRLPQPGREPKPTAVVVGFGATGAALADALRRRGYAVVVTDTDDAKLRAARDAGFEVAAKADALGRADFLFGATGRGSLSEQEWALVKSGAILANGASGTHELGLVDGSPNARDRDKRTDAHGTVTTSFCSRALTLGNEIDDERLRHRVVRARDAHGQERELLLLRGGAVVNMEHDLPPEYRQIIVAMLLASCFQAVNETEPGPHDLDPQVQQFLRARFEKALAAEGLSMTRPDLDAVRGPWG